LRVTVVWGGGCGDARASPVCGSTELGCARLNPLLDGDLVLVHPDEGLPLAAGQVVQAGPDRFDLPFGHAVDAVVVLGDQAVLRSKRREPGDGAGSFTRSAPS